MGIRQSEASSQSQKIARKAYKTYKKTGKLNAATLKKAGIGELVDIAGDLTTIFSGDASVLDRITAATDLIVGTDFNQQGNARVVKTIEGEVKKLKKGPVPNGGKAKPHDGEKHNDAIDDYIENKKASGEGSNIRKNQVQVDVNGNRVGNNRPDVQYDYKGQHHYVEFDNNPNDSAKHERTIRRNDPNCHIETHQL